MCFFFSSSPHLSSAFSWTFLSLFLASTFSFPLFLIHNLRAKYFPATHLVLLSFLNRLPHPYVIHREKPAQIHPYLISLCAATNTFESSTQIHQEALAGKLCYATNFYALRLSAKKRHEERREFCRQTKTIFVDGAEKPWKCCFEFSFLSFRCHEGMISWKQRFTVKNFIFYSPRFEKAVWKVKGEASCM